MKAYIVATGFFEGLKPIVEHHPQPLFPLVDRPVIQHIVEGLVEINVKEIDFLLFHYPERLESFLGDGKRWGCSFKYHLLRNPDTAIEKLRTLPMPDDSSFLIGDATVIPDFKFLFNFFICDPIKLIESLPTIFTGKKRGDLGNESINWTGWAILNQPFIDEFLNEKGDDGCQKKLLQLYEEGSICNVTLDSIEIKSLSDFSVANNLILSKHFPFIMVSRPENDPGIWIARNVSIHPAVHFMPPLYIGENSQIGANTSIGPNVVIGSDCFLDENCSVKESWVFPGSYVGEGLDLKNSIIHHRTLVNLEIGTSFTVTDDFLLAPLRENPLKKWTKKLFGRFLAFIAFIAVSPIFLIIYFSLLIWEKKNPLFSKQYVRIPTEGTPETWKFVNVFSFIGGDDLKENSKRQELYYLFLRIIPGLINVIRGDISLVGLPLRTKQEILELPADWRSAYLKCKAGLFGETMAVHGFISNIDEQCACEMYYTVASGFWCDVNILKRYFFRALKNFIQ
ncbi:MAG: sugar transferase [Candidatus Riflebacteria bacterium]|nr:sugar transferase [Candidatus Riflebacteria bacterium]